MWRFSIVQYKEKKFRNSNKEHEIKRRKQKKNYERQVYIAKKNIHLMHKGTKTVSFHLLNVSVIYKISYL